MTQAGFAVDPSALNQHAASVSQRGEDVSGVASGLGTVTLPGDILGQVGQQAIGAVQQAISQAQQAINQASQSMRSQSFTLNQNASGYQQNDQDCAQGLGTIQSGQSTQAPMAPGPDHGPVVPGGSQWPASDQV